VGILNKTIYSWWKKKKQETIEIVEIYQNLYGRQAYVSKIGTVFLCWYLASIAGDVDRCNAVHCTAMHYTRLEFIRICGHPSEDCRDPSIFLSLALSKPRLRNGRLKEWKFIFDGNITNCTCGWKTPFSARKVKGQGHIMLRRVKGQRHLA